MTAKPQSRRERWRRDPRAGLLGIAAVVFALFLIFVAIALLLPGWHAVDMSISGFVRAFRNPALTQFAKLVTQLGSAPVIIVLGLVTVVWLAFMRRLAAIVYLVSTVAVGWLLGAVILQNVLHRARPLDVNLIPVPGGYSLPSGHALASFLLYASLAVVFTLNAPTGRRLKRWVGLGAAVIILLVGWSRVYLGVHWFGDVIAAWLFGGAWWAFTTGTYLGSVTEKQRERGAFGR